NALQHAYHQIPAEVRSRWRASYDRYMAQQPKPQAEKPKSWWERILEQTGESQIMAAEAQREAAQLQGEILWDFAQGANETIRVNMFMGLYQQRDYHPKHPIAGKAGEVAGNVASTVQGSLELIAGAGGEGLSVVMAPTGILTPVSVLTAALSAGLAAHGGSLAYSGASNTGQSSAELWQMIKDEGKPGSSKPSKPKEKPPKAEGTKQDLLSSNGKFKDSKLESDYEKYLARKAKEGKPARDRLEWKEEREYWLNDSPMARGNAFNKKAEKEEWYPVSELHLTNGKRLDSYDPIKGEIVSRKATDLEVIDKSTFESYLKELKTKYSSGTVIRSNAYPELDGLPLTGKQILEIPDSNKSFSQIQEYIDLAKNKYGIEIRFRGE
ncbi:hypothetical protein J2Z22_003285, partial [Paenibacillus forsythiae]|nr:hypothetical protein [Paenibacillus forsythiae]